MTFEELLSQLKNMRITAAQWADLNYAVTLDEDSEKWVSKSTDDIGDELEIQARRVKNCNSQIDQECALGGVWLPKVLSQLEALGTKLQGDR